jgi:molybdopterin-binding protein
VSDQRPPGRGDDDTRAAQTEPLLLAEDVSVMRGGRVLVRVERLGLHGGRTHVVLGPNGAGKSTLLRGLNGLEPVAGRLAFAGGPIHGESGRRSLRRATATVLQRPFLLATSVRGNVESGLRLRGVRGEDLARRAAAAMDLLGIAHLASRSRDGLSGGEAQRVSIARALAVDPAILFLDEPMASLDPPTRRALLTDMLRILGERSTSAVWVTHDRDEALSVGDEVTFLSRGEVIQQGACLEVFARPATTEVADFLGQESYLEGEVQPAENGAPQRLVLASGAIILCGEAAPGPALACIYPENVVLFNAPPPVGSTSLRNIATGTVGDIRTVGRLRHVLVRCEGFELVSAVTQAALEELDLHPEATVTAAFKATAVHILARHARR